MENPWEEPEPHAPPEDGTTTRAYVNTSFSYLLGVTSVAAIPAILQFYTWRPDWEFTIPFVIFYIRTLGLTPSLLALDHFISQPAPEDIMPGAFPPNDRSSQSRRDFWAHHTLRAFTFIAYLATILWATAGFLAVIEIIMTIKYESPSSPIPTDPDIRLKVILSLVEGALDLLVAGLSYREATLFSRARKSIPLETESPDDSEDISESVMRFFRKVATTTLQDVWTGTLNHLSDIRESIWVRREGSDRAVVCLLMTLGLTTGGLAFYEAYHPPTLFFSFNYLHVPMFVLMFIFTFAFHRYRTADFTPGEVVWAFVSSILFVATLLCSCLASFFILVALRGLFCNPYGGRKPYHLPCTSKAGRTFVMGMLELLLTFALASSAVAVWRTRGRIQLEPDSEDFDS